MRLFKTLLRVALDFCLIAGMWLYVYQGAPLAPFHGDEGMHICSSGDFDLLLEKGPSALASPPPHEVDSEKHLRLSTGTVSDWAIGAVRRSQGLGADRLPRLPGWNWTLSVLENIEAGYFPEVDLLVLGRMTSSAFHALCAIPAFLIGWHLWKRPGAWMLAALFVLHPALLLNGRRTMLEAPMFFFGLWTVWFGLTISKALWSGRSASFWKWAGLALAGGAAMASKHSGFIFVACAGAMISAAPLIGRARSGRALACDALGLGLSIFGALLFFIALTPGVWDNPPARIRDLLAIRVELVKAVDDGTQSGLLKQLWRLLYMPFAAPPQYFEVREWIETPGLEASITNYTGSGLAGLPVNGPAGWFLSLTALFGAAWSCARREIDGLRLALCAGVAALLIFSNPLPWQRYYLPLIPFYAGLFVVALRQGWGMLMRSGISRWK